MTNSPHDAAEIAARLHRLVGLNQSQIDTLSLTLDPLQVDAISDVLLASLASGTLPGLPINPDGGLPLGMPGAVANTRWVGATNSGAPSTGSFRLGDFVIAQDGHVWVCTVAGSPGTWTDVALADLVATPDASTTVKGLVKLAGDLAGTATAPTVPGLTGKLTKPGSGLDGKLTKWDNTAGQLVDGSSAVMALGTGTFASLGALNLVRPASPDIGVIMGTQSGHSITLSGTPASSNLNDTGDYVLGSQCVSFTTSTAGQTISVKYDTITPSLDMTGKGFVFWVKFSDYTSLTQVDVQVIDSTGTSSWVYATALKQSGAADTQQYAQSGEWLRLLVPFSCLLKGTITGTPNRASIGNVRVRFYSTAGQTLTAKFNGMGTYAEPITALPNGLISLTYDDVYSSQYSIVRPALDKYGYRATLYPIVEFIDNGRLTSAQLNALHDGNGWEIGYHCMTQANHTTGLPNLSSADLAAELQAGRQWQISNGWGDSPSMAYPRGQFNASVIAAVRKYWASARTVWGLEPEVVGTPYPYRLRCTDAAGLSLAQLQAEVDKAKQAHAWKIFVFHDVAATLSGSDAEQVTTANHNGLIDYINAQGVPVLPVGEAMRLTARA